MGKGLTNWQKILRQDNSDKLAYRDVYQDQQLDRSSLPEQQSKTSYFAAAALLTVIVFIFMWVFSSLWQLVMGFLSGEFKADLVGMPADHFLHYLVTPHPIKVALVFAVSIVFFFVMYAVLMRKWKAQNTMSDTSEINQYHNDQHIALPEEIQQKFDWFPDVGCTSDVQPSSMISHVAISNKGLKTIKVSQRAKQDILDEDGEIVMYKGEVLRDEADRPIQKDMPLVDIDFANALFEASGMPDDKNIRKFYDTTRIPYNGDGKNRDKLGKYETVADLINADWEFPWYEPQRPGGAYLVDTAPVV